MRRCPLKQSELKEQLEIELIQLQNSLAELRSAMPDTHGFVAHEYHELVEHERLLLHVLVKESK